MCKFDCHSSSKKFVQQFFLIRCAMVQNVLKADACKVMEHNVYEDNVTSGYNCYSIMMLT